MALTPGSLSQVAVTSVSASLLSGAAVSGTSPYTYQWYRSGTSGFTPGVSNAIAGATALSLDDTGLTPLTVYYYKVVSVDSNATPATVSSSQLSVTTLSQQNDLSISNVINVSVATPQTGIGAPNTSNVALFTRENPVGSVDSYNIYLSPTDVATDWGTGSTTYAMALQIFSQQPNILLPGGYLVVIPFLSSETIAAAITRTAGLVQYFGIMQTEIPSQVNMLAGAAVVQALNKIMFVVSYDPASVETGGYLDLLRSGSFTHTRGLYYGDVLLTALEEMASYVGRALSVVFSGSNTTQNMNLKTLSGTQPDPSMSQTLLNKCLIAGADVYVSIQGVPKVLCSGANSFFDQVYNLLAFVNDIQVGYFNVLAETNTKIPQTEGGMALLKGSCRQVCEQYVTNQYLAPGTWTSPDTFGNQSDLYQNVAQRGYYIYSAPISQQSPTDRSARIAPLVQIAIKEAGAIDKGSLIINVNA